ncbi:MAG: PilZ domain-containing protein [Limibacillus sp.]|jgi:hypothetical protein
MLYDRFSNATKTLGAGDGISDPRDRRQFPRSKGACELYYEKERYELIDWSAGGCAVEGLTGLAEGDKIDVTLRISGKRTALVQNTKARVIRVEKESVALKFLDLSIEERDLLLIAQGAFSDNVFVMDLNEDQIV